MCSYTCGPQSQRLASSNAVARNNLFWPRTLFGEAITVPPRRGGCDCLGTHFRPNRGLTNTRQRTHRKPPLSSSTPSQDPATCSTSLTSPSRLRSSPLHVHTTVRTLATPHLHCDFTSWEDALGLHTETPRIAPHNAPIRELSVPQHTPAQRILQPKIAEKLGGIFPRLSAHLRTTSPDDSVLVRPTLAQKPEPGSPIRSATGVDLPPSRHWHPTIPEHACVVSDAFPSSVSRIVAIRSAGCSLLLTDRPLPPSVPTFPPPPHRRDDDHHHCIEQMSVVACGSQTILPSLTAHVVCVRCVVFPSASLSSCRVLTWLVGCESKQADGTIPLDHACPFHSRESDDPMDK